MKKTYNEIYTELKKHNQLHLLNFFNELNEKEKAMLLDSIAMIDLDEADRLYESTTEDTQGSMGQVYPIGFTDIKYTERSERDKWTKRGIELIEAGKYAALTMAGGQGTRLGHNGPKGTYDIGLSSGWSLFQIQCERLKNRSLQCGRKIPWYIMTSYENDSDTKSFFEEKDYFGYGKENIIFFKQNMLPMLSFDGKIILENKYTVKMGANGHGGVFTSVYTTGMLDDMKRRGIEKIYVGGIDNVLSHPDDALFLGFTDVGGYLIGGKSVVKNDPYEKAGVFCIVDGKPFVKEYTEITKEMAELRNERGEYVYADAHILCNMFDIRVFEDLKQCSLPYHTARKKTSYISEGGDVIVPSEPNAFKFELFIFDAFHFYGDMGILRVDRANEFAPVKNKEGADSSESARRMYIEYMKNAR